MTRTTRAGLTTLVNHLQAEARDAAILKPGDNLVLIPGLVGERPWRLRVLRHGSTAYTAFEPADGNGGDIGRTPREAEHVLRIMWYTLQAANRARRTRTEEDNR